MALWLIALAQGANLPRRLVYVVDRRAVVDQATWFAEQLRCNMPADLADRLGLGRKGTLPISTLRGGFADNRKWLEDPSSPAIIVGTIDMIGSRLFFEGYSVSRHMRPYHAGLLGVDSLVLLDEAHLCPPFEALLRRIAAQRDSEFGPKLESGPITPPFRLMSLSATGRDVKDMPSESVFRLEARDSEEPLIQQRLLAAKRLKIVELDDPKSLTKSIVDRAVELNNGDVPCRVLVYCHSRKTALEVKKEIDKKCKQMQRAGELATRHESELLVGERRVYERTELEDWLKTQGFLGNAKGAPQCPAFLVATSAGEVGVDMDADHMVCDLVAYERMVQRLGRVNRRGGEERSAMVDVFAVQPPPPKANAKKTQHEKELETLRNQMKPLRLLPRGEDGRHDASPSAIVDLKRHHRGVVDDATTPTPLYPKLTRPLVDAWAMTSLKQHEGRPEIAPWLRGWEEDNKLQTELVWRKHLPCLLRGEEISLSPSRTTDFFRSVPIHATEKLEALSERVFDWLLKRVAQVGKRSGDHALAIQDDEIVAILLDRAGEYVAHASLSNIRHLVLPAKSLSKDEQRKRDRQKEEWKKRLLPNALLVVDARIGGLRDGMLDADEKSEDKVSVADSDANWREPKSNVASAEQPRPLVDFRVEEVTNRDQGEGLAIPDEFEGWRHVRTFETKFNDSGTVRHGLAIFKRPQESTDEDARSIASSPQALAEHARQVATRARDLATRLKLPQDEIEAICIAAQLHDEGKAAPRWQNAMNAPKNDRPYAKTRGGCNWRLLEGYRHEFGSLLKAESENIPDNYRDLILHLIAAHHGRARPIIRSAGCNEGPPSLLEAKAGNTALRFIRLQKHYGPWGLAWREAILRAADQGASREQSNGRGEQRNG